MVKELQYYNGGMGGIDYSAVSTTSYAPQPQPQNLSTQYNAMNIYGTFVEDQKLAKQAFNYYTPRDMQPLYLAEMADEGYTPDVRSQMMYAEQQRRRLAPTLPMENQMGQMM